MKKWLLPLWLFISACTANAQFKNPGFEQKVNTNLPADWNLGSVAGYSAMLTDSVKHQGNYALKMTGNPANPSTFMNVTQTLDVNYKELKQIKITAYIKTENLKGNVAMWCQIWDGHRKQIGFENSGMQGVSITGTTDWQKYTMTLIVSKEARNLYFGVYTMGTGTVWFDDFAIEELQGSDQEPTAEVISFSKRI